MSAPAVEEENSFVQTEMRGAAMKLHTRDQAPKEGQQPAQKPVQAWEPQKEDYLQFLVDSRAVYGEFEELIATVDDLAPFRNSGLERKEALDKDIEWFVSEGMEIPPLGPIGTEYIDMLRGLAKEERWPSFVCHFYNHYFAHTAGGIMIGKMMADKLLDSKTLNFYKWEAGDVKGELLPALRKKIDGMAMGWTREQKDMCLDETAASFKYGGSLLKYIRGGANSGSPH